MEKIFDNQDILTNTSIDSFEFVNRKTEIVKIITTFVFNTFHFKNNASQWRLLKTTFCDQMYGRYLNS
jgi:hypothetical protein